MIIYSPTLSGSTISEGDIIVSGSVISSDGFTGSVVGSLLGTSSWATNLNAGTCSVSNNIILGGYLVNTASTVPNNSNFVGTNAGYAASSANNSNFFGAGAGTNATGANDSNFFGASAGNGANGANNSNFFGASAGLAGQVANNSNFFGASAGQTAYYANNSNFFGQSAGNNAQSANNSNFFGTIAGQNATNAYNSIFIGYQAGNGATNANNSIFIGYNAGNNNNTVNNSSGPKFSILIGDYTSTSGHSNAICIGKGAASPNSQSLNLANIIYATGVYTGSTATSASQVNGKVGIGIIVPINTLDVFGNISASVITASLFYGTSSWSNTSLTASYITASNVNGTVSSASYSLNSVTASYIPASGVVGLNLSQIATGSVTASVNVGSASFQVINNNISSIFVSSSGNIGIGIITPVNKLDVVGNISASIITASLFYGTASWANNSLTASYITASNINGTVTSASYSLNSTTASYIDAGNITTGTLNNSRLPSQISVTAITTSYLSASNASFDTVIINGSLTVTQITSSQLYITSSQLVVTDNILTLNALTPHLRYAGIEMYDSGSTQNLSSFLWDGQNNYFFVSSSDAGYSRKLITGPDSEGDLTVGYIPVATGSNGLINSIISQSNNAIVINGNLTASNVNATLIGTSSWAISSSWSTIQLPDITDDTVNHRIGINNTNPQVSLDVIGAGRFSGSVDENTSLAGVQLGTLNGTPRIVFGNGTVSQNWQIDQSSGFFRWYQPGTVYLALTTSSLTVGGQGGASRLSVLGGISIGNSYYNIAAPTNGLIVQGKVGIGQSSATNSLDVAGNISASVITASLFYGTASWANNAVTSSYISASNIDGTVTSASYALSSSYALNSRLLNSTSSTTFATTGSNTLKGKQKIEACVSFAVSTDPDPTGADTTSSYLFQSASNNLIGNDLYVRQDGNLVKWKWIESQLGSGILYGGALSYTGSTITASAGAGVIVTYNASLTTEVSPVIKYVTWNAQSLDISASISSSQATYAYIDSNGILQTQDDTFFTNVQYEQSIPLGMFNHTGRNVITSMANDAYTAYKTTNQSFDFIQAFGPLKINGLSLSGQSGNLSINIGSGTSFILGGFYQQDPNIPSVKNTSTYYTASLARVYRSGSTFITDNNSGAFYTTVDPSNYDVGNGTLATVGGNYTIQRVFFNPFTGKVHVYYGQATYNTLDTAVANLASDPFSEAIYSSHQYVFVGYLVLKGTTSDLTLTTNKIVQSGLFRNTIGSSGTTTFSNLLSSLSDVNITSPTNGQSLIYNSGVWVNGVSSTSSYAQTSSWSNNSISASYIPASGVVGLNLSQIATGSVTASVNVNSASFQVINNGNTSLFVSSSGNVGIGINTPDYKLQVDGVIAPTSNGVYSLGTTTNRFSDLFAVQGTIGAFFEVGLRTEGIGVNKTGTIVSWKNGKLIPCEIEEDELVMGVIKEGKDEPIILGAETILVTGVVSEGDYIVTSNKKGHGKAVKRGSIFKKDLFGKVIAQALEPSNSESNLIKAMIRKF